MAKGSSEVVEKFAAKITNSTTLSADEKTQLLADLHKLSPLLTDPTIYRLVVVFLGLAVVLTIIGGFALSLSSATDIPQGLIALGSAAVGALAGLLAPSPAGK